MHTLVNNIFIVYTERQQKQLIKTIMSESWNGCMNADAICHFSSHDEDINASQTTIVAVTMATMLYHA